MDMIYFIGGAPRVGKSIVSKALAEAEGIELVSTDDVEDRVSTVLSEAQRRTFFPLPGFSGDPSENVLTPKERVELQIISSKSLEGEIKSIVAKVIDGHQDLVIEGIHLLPEMIHELIDVHGENQIRGCFIGSVDARRILLGMAKNADPNDWLKDANEKVREQVAEFVVAFSRYIQEEARKNSFLYFERTDTFELDRQRITELLLKLEEETT